MELLLLVLLRGQDLVRVSMQINSINNNSRDLVPALPQ